RSNSWTPTVCSSRLSERDSAGCEMCSVPDSRVRLGSSTAATNQRSSCSCTMDSFSRYRDPAVVAGPHVSDELQLQRLAEERAALRRVATLVASGAETDTLFALVAEQVAGVLGAPLVSIVRYESDGTASERASYSPDGPVFTVGTRWSLDGTSVVARIRD